MTRIFFRFDLEFTYHAHAMATWLKRDFGLTDASFGGMVDGRLYHRFLVEGQSDIAYEHVGLNQDLLWRARTEPPDMDYLRRMERELDVDSLWRLLDAERWIPDYTYEQVLSAMTLFLKFYEREFTECRPDAVIGFATATMYGLACYYMARHFDIPFLEVMSTRLRERFVVEDSVTGQEFRHVDERFRELLAGRDDQSLIPAASDYIKRFRSQPRAADGLQRAMQITGSRTSLHPRRLLSLARVSYWYYFGHYRHDPEQVHPAKQTVETLRLVARRRRLIAGGYFERPRLGERFAYYALHLQPEMSTMIQAPFWQDQLALIENIARSLPLDVRLYVKEHAPMVGVRPLSYYERIKAIRNVRLVDPALSSIDLIRDSELVVTITGTVGFEALLIGRPVITFGQVFYNAVPCVQRCRAIEDLPVIIRSVLERSPHDDRQVAAYVAALLDESVRIDGDELYVPTIPYEVIREGSVAREMYRGFVRALRRFGVLDVEGSRVRPV